jgi:hypothetical protein
MLALETAQLFASDAQYEKLYPDWDAPDDTSVKLTGFVLSAQPAVRRILADPRKSAALANALRPASLKFGIV